MDPNKVSKDGLYPIAAEDRGHLPTVAGSPGEVRARWTGEHRPPRSGEWYLSGAIVEAYRAPNDLPTTRFHIAVLVRPERTVTRWVEV